MPGWQLFKSFSKLIKLNNWLTKWSAFPLRHVHRSLPKTATTCISAASGGDIVNIQTVWQKLESDNCGSFQYSTPFDWAADTNSYLLLSDQTHEPYRYRRAGQYTSLPPKGLHLLSEMIFNKVWPRKYRVECSCLDLAYGVKEEKNTLLELRWKSRLPEETALRFLCLCRVVHFILHCSGTKPQSAATHEPWGCNGMPLWNI